MPNPTQRSQGAVKSPSGSSAPLIAFGLAIGAFYLPHLQGAVAHRDQVNAALNAVMSLAFAAQTSALMRLGRVGWAPLVAVLAMANVFATGPYVLVLAYGACVLCAATFVLWAGQRHRLAHWFVWLSGSLAAASKLLIIWPR